MRENFAFIIMSYNVFVHQGPETAEEGDCVKVSESDNRTCVVLALIESLPQSDAFRQTTIVRLKRKVFQIHLYYGIAEHHSTLL